MGIIYSFESSKERIELSELEKSIASNPFSKGSYFNFYFNKAEISAMNFILEYCGNYDKVDLDNLLANSMKSAGVVSEFLLEQRLLDINNTELYWNDDKNQDWKIRVELFDPYFHNEIINTFPNRGLNGNNICRVILNTYINSFLNFFNEKEVRENIKFPTKNLAKKMAMKNLNQKLVKTLKDHEDFKDKYDLGFLPIKGDNLSTWNVGYFSKN